MNKLRLIFTFLFLAGMNLYSQTTLLTEGWESTTDNSNVPPAGWGLDIVTGANITYYVSSGTNPTVTPFEGSRLVNFMSNTYPGISNRLKTTSSISTVGYPIITVDFEWYTDNGWNGYFDGVTVQWSTNGTTWNNTSFFNRYDVTNQWVLESVSLPAGAGNQATLYVAFLFRSAYGDDCHMDIMHVNGYQSASPPTATTNAASHISGSFATLNGIINASDFSTAVTFQYGLTISYTNTVAGIPSPVLGSTNTAVAATIFGLTPNTVYHYRVTGVNGGGTTNGLDQIFTTSPYCAPNYSFGCGGNDLITQFQLNTINQSIDCSGTPSWYQDFTAVSTNLTIGMPYTITLKVAMLWGDAATAWIDYNHNNIFDAGEMIGQVVCNNPDNNISFTVPATALTGATRLRVMTEYQAYPTGPCSSQNYGNCCDFTVNIINNSPIPALSEWGLIIFGILLLSTGTIFINRRKPGIIRLK